MVLFLKNLLFTLLVPGMVAVVVPLTIVWGNAVHKGWRAFLGWPLLAMGAAIYCWCVWDFATFGRGTPAPIDAPKRLVVRGLYRYSRNPMYVGVLTTILGWALLFTLRCLLLYWVGVALCFQTFVVLYEEPRLRQLFGEEYDEYTATVHRWLPFRRRG